MGNTIKFPLTILSRQNDTWLFRHILCICFQDKREKIIVASEKHIFYFLLQLAQLQNHQFDMMGVALVYSAT